MFGFLIGKEVNDDAVRLKMLADRFVSSYLSLPENERRAALVRDFPAQESNMDRDGATIIFPDLSVFQFYIPFTGGITDQVMISGKGKYAGFSLGCTRNGMSCSVRDGLAYSATGGAKKLGQVMTKKFGVMDMDRLPF